MNEQAPLPVRNASARLEEVSLNRLRAVLPEEKLLIRDDRIMDYGVDLHLEAAAGDFITNYRSCAQVRARADLPENTDGSVSLSIQVSTLNYLLNGSCPILFVYIGSTDEFRYLFIRDEITTLEERNPLWQQQQEVTLRLQDVVDSDGIDLIHSRITEEANLHREVFDRICRVQAGENVILRVDPDDVTVTSSDEALSFLLEHGLSLVSRGHTSKVLEVAQLLSADEDHLGDMISYVLGYAYFSQGEYLRARRLFANILEDGSSLSEDERAATVAFSLSCDLGIGSINRDEYIGRMRVHINEMPASLRYQYELALMREALLSEADFSARDTKREQIVEYADAVISDAGVGVRVKDSARLYKLEVEIEKCAMGLSGLLSGILSPEIEVLRERFGATTQQQEAMDSAMYLERALGELNELFQRSMASHEPRFVMEVWYTFIFGSIALRRQALLINEIANREVLSFSDLPDEEAITGLEEMAEGLSNTEFALRIRMLRAQLLEVCNRHDEAVLIAEEVRRASSILSLSKPLATAEAFLSGDSSILPAIEEIRSRRGIPSIQQLLSVDEGSLDDVAKDICEHLGIPADRSDVMLSNLMFARCLGGYQREWCKHLNYVEHKYHERSQETFYAEYPQKVITCALKGILLNNPGTEAEVLCNAFKDRVCAGCSEREPYSM